MDVQREHHPPPNSPECNFGCLEKAGNVRVDGGGISGRWGSVMGGERHVDAGAEKEHRALVPHVPTAPAPATLARLGIEAGEGVQARLTVHRQGGSLAGQDVVGHVALPHQGADPQLLRGLLGPPQAGETHGGGHQESQEQEAGQSREDGSDDDHITTPPSRPCVDGP